MPTQGGLAAMLAESGADRSLVSTTKEIEEMPGGPELLYTFAAEEAMNNMGLSKKTRRSCVCTSWADLSKQPVVDLRRQLLDVPELRVAATTR